jgi:hypothetical protein
MQVILDQFKALKRSFQYKPHNILVDVYVKTLCIFNIDKVSVSLIENVLLEAKSKRKLFNCNMRRQSQFLRHVMRRCVGEHCDK